jgi:purine-binding chemotaxis protein CheW
MRAAQAQRLVVCRLDDQRFALPVAAIDRVLPAMAYQPFANPQSWLSGTAEVHGDRVPVLDIRRRLGCEPREPQPEDMFVLATSGGQQVGFFIDAVEGVVDGLAALPVHDLERLFPTEAAPT